jgi:hypothetical protein
LCLDEKKHPRKWFSLNKSSFKDALGAEGIFCGGVKYFMRVALSPSIQPAQVE